MDLAYIVILSKQNNLKYVLKNIKYFTKYLIFNNTDKGILNTSLSSSKIINLPKEYYEVDSYAKLRNYCLQYLMIGQKYIFLDDDEEIINFVTNDNVDFAKIYINNFPSTVRIFKFSHIIKYNNIVHEEINIKSNNIIDISVLHHIDENEYQNKLIKYANMTNSLYYKVRNYLYFNQEFILSNDEIDLNNVELDFILIINLTKKIFNFDHNISNEIYNILEEKIVILKLNTCDQNFFNKLIYNKKPSFNDVMQQNFYQNKSQLLLYI